MEIKKATEFLNSQMTKHGLIEQGWVYKINPRLNCLLGRCSYRDRTITLSKNYVDLNIDRLVEDTILHEIAHALVGSGYGHGQVWKSKCVELGCRPIRCKSEFEIVMSNMYLNKPHKWSYTCEKGCCKGTKKRYNGYSKYRCKICKTRVIWSINKGEI